MLLTFLSCSDDDQKKCIGFRPEFITDVRAPSTGIINQTVEIEVDFVVYNGCGKFNKFFESGNDYSKTIGVEAKYEGCICTQNIPTITAIYELTPNTPGEYELNFKSGESDFITVNISIN